MADKAKRWWGLENAWGYWSTLATAAVVIATGIAIDAVNDLRIMFGVLAVSSGAVAAVGALLRMLAHNQADRKGLDGLGKALGFNAALLGVTAAGLILYVQIQYPDLPV